MNIKGFIADHIVSWILEVLMVTIIGMYSIHEIRKTGEETRAVIQRYDKAISSTATATKDATTDIIKDWMSSKKDQ